MPAQATPAPAPTLSARSAAVRSFVSIVGGLSTAFGVFAALLLCAAMLVISHMILIRYVFRSPTIWHTDFAVYSATAAVFLGAPYVLLVRGHVGVDVVEAMAPPRARRALRAVGSLLGLAFCVAMLVATVMFTQEAWTNEWRTPGVWQIPLWIPSVPLPIGFTLLSLQYVAGMLDPGAGRTP